MFLIKIEKRIFLIGNVWNDFWTSQLHLFVINKCSITSKNEKIRKNWYFWLGHKNGVESQFVLSYSISLQIRYTTHFFRVEHEQTMNLSTQTWKTPAIIYLKLDDC